MQKNSNLRTIGFATILGLVCSILLTFANIQTKPLRLANEKAEELTNYLFVLDVPVSPGAKADDLLKIFDKSIRVKEAGGIKFYEYYPENSSDDKPVAVAVAFNGPGLWDKIGGVIALEPDLKTIKGISFYKQAETPGLGGEIASDWFQSQFIGKSIISPSGTPGFKILKPEAATDSNSVDGISGATMTSSRVEVILEKLAGTISNARSAYEQ
ncbi:MAG: FMN-binding protein [Spirochaetia bacterium]|jgi:Na+-transporting NADH:ubiquinone oxidoreductase subunit C|nr:FMN-binding protein [Spirochaetia bacterium]